MKSRVPGRHALLVGIDRYPGLGREAQLRGAVRDVEQMSDLLEHRFAFRSPDICLLKQNEATRQRVLSAMDAVVEQAKAGDVVVFHWSGHGSRMTDREGDEPDGLDETLVPVDACRDAQQRIDSSRDISDDEVRIWLARLEQRGALATLILDCCHSGHGHRRRHRRHHARVRQVEADRRPAAELPLSPQVGAEGACRADWLPRSRNHVLLAACRDDQLAYECRVGDGYHGCWTYALLQQLHQDSSLAITRDVFEGARRRLLVDSPEQDSLLAGQRDRLIFGVEARPRRRFITLESWDPKHGRGTLAGGAIHGLVGGSLWDVKAPTASAEWLAQIRLVKVDAATSGVCIESDEASRADGRSTILTPGDRAFEAVPAYGESKLPVSLSTALATGKETPQHESLTRAIRSSPLLYLTNKQDADCFVELEERAEELAWGLYDQHGRSLWSSHLVTQSAALPQLVDRLEKRARHRHALKLSNQDPESQLNGRVHLRCVDFHTRQSRHDFVAGERFVVEIEHDFAHDLFVYLLDLGAADGVQLIHPDAGGEDLLVSGLCQRIGTQPGDPLIASFPDDPHLRNTAAVTSYLKLFASTKAVDFEWLESGARLRTYDAETSSLQQLLTMSLPGAGLRKASSDDWATALVSLRIHRR